MYMVGAPKDAKGQCLVIWGQTLVKWRDSRTNEWKAATGLKVKDSNTDLVKISL